MDKFIVITGSTKFLDEFIEAYVRIACEGNIPFTVAGNLKGRFNYDTIKPPLDAMYQKVIRDYADELFVLNVGGYIGESGRKEIQTAMAKGIPIKYLEKHENET